MALRCLRKQFSDAGSGAVGGRRYRSDRAGPTMVNVGVDLGSRQASSPERRRYLPCLQDFTGFRKLGSLRLVARAERRYRRGTAVSKSRITTPIPHFDCPFLPATCAFPRKNSLSQLFRYCIVSLRRELESLFSTILFVSCRI